MAASHTGIAGVGVAAGALVCLAVLRAELGHVGLLLDGLMALVAARGAWTASRLARTPRSRRAWQFQRVAPLIWAMAPIAWFTGAPPVVASVPRVVFLVLVAAAWWFASHAGDTWSRVRLVVDGGLGMASVFVAGWTLGLRETWAVTGGGVDGVLAIVVPLGAVGVATYLVGLASTEMQGRHRLMPAGYVAGMVVIAWSDVAWGVGRTPAWSVGFGLFFLATRAYAGTSRRRELVSTGRNLTSAPYVLVAPAALALAVQGARGDISTPEGVAAIVMVALLLVRQHVTLLENRVLVHRLAATERLLRHQATHDALTGLPGRVVLWGRLEEVSARQDGTPFAVAVVFVDLDDFKAVNDVHGHAAGDHLLVETARRLRDALTHVGDDALAVRMSGDEFAVLLVGRAAEQSADLARQILAAIQRPVTVNGASVSVGGSVGVASTDSAALNPSALLRAADVAMYDVKHDGKGGVRVAEPDGRR
ncbi:cyclic di-GMP phosphodiesterase Gmr [mine drainage metagenome]|uniref:Cyclic di-GMP phosphodiesterase Gmr n=1 Tax=mine drainage metagenome TaxID=410659 RepID=A0A1J5QZ00_9ZZZZ